MFTNVEKETTTGVVPIDVQVEGSSQQALHTKAGGYRAGLKLDSSVAFSVSKTVSATHFHSQLPHILIRSHIG